MLDIIIIIIMITNAFVRARLSRADKMDLCFEINDDTSLCRITHGTLAGCWRARPSAVRNVCASACARVIALLTPGARVFSVPPADSLRWLFRNY